jgi:hypothetical protein
VFSEIYYEKGWNAYVDGALTPHFCCDYVLRGMVVPAGKHTIEFKFEPAVVILGETISLVSSIFLYGGIVIVGGFALLKRKRKKTRRKLIYILTEPVKYGNALRVLFCLFGRGIVVCDLNTKAQRRRSVHYTMAIDEDRCSLSSLGAPSF